MDEIKNKIISKIKLKFKKKITNNIYQQRDMIIADISQILTQAIKEGKIKSFEKVKVIIKDDKIKITSNVWPFFGGQFKLDIII